MSNLYSFEPNNKSFSARTIIFMSWDAEEYGLIGSTEFVEEFTEILNKRAVAYLNMDCLHGNKSVYVSVFKFRLL